MTSDLVVRLRTWADRHEADMLDMSASLEREAADRIEELELCLRNVLPLLDETAPEVAASVRALEAK